MLNYAVLTTIKRYYISFKIYNNFIGRFQLYINSFTQTHFSIVLNSVATK